MAAGGKKAKAATSPAPSDSDDAPSPGGPDDAEEQAARTEALQESLAPAAATAKQTVLTVAKPSAQQMADAVVAALATGNPETVRDTSAALATKGYQYSAQLDAIAADMARAAATRGKALATPEETMKAAASQPDVNQMQLPEDEAAEPGAGAPATPEASTSSGAGKAAAEALAAHLRSRKKGTEDKAKVKAYQTAAGLKPDGLFGPQTAADVASYGVVPPVKNLYWPADFMQAKRDLAAVLLQYAEQFPPQRAAMTAEAKSIK
jgi:peptidoglycan hydrolase-like protein with peptidoglycan-binding domain